MRPVFGPYVPPGSPQTAHQDRAADQDSAKSRRKLNTCSRVSSVTVLLAIATIRPNENTRGGRRVSCSGTLCIGRKVPRSCLNTQGEREALF